jgi:hypothetical protein
MPLVGGGEVFVVVGGGELLVVVGGGVGVGVGAGVGVGDEVVVGGGAWLVVVGVATATGFGGRTVTTRLAWMWGFDASVTRRSWRPAATPWNVILAPALRLIEPRT